MNRYLKAALGEQTDRPPLWMMRQAGRYLPEYREIRGNHSFLDLVYTPGLATEITLQPIRRYQMDAAILFSDILVTAEALGADLAFIEKKGPVFPNPIRTQNDLNSLLQASKYHDLSPIYETITRLRNELNEDTALIGFAGAPFTVASYMIEGGSSPHLKTVKQIIGNTPNLLTPLLDALTDVTVDYLNNQIKAGVQAIQLFDTWAGLLSYNDFETFSASYMKQIINRLNNPLNIPITVFCKNSSVFFESLSQIGAQVVALDHTANLKQFADTRPSNISLQGNLDPYLLYANDDILTERVTEILNSMANQPGYIFNLGHGCMPDMDPDKIGLVATLVQRYSNSSD